MGIFISGGSALYAMMLDRYTRPSDVLPEQWWDADHANMVKGALIDVQAFLRGGFQLFDADGANPVSVINGTGAPAIAAAKGSVYVDRANAKLYQNSDGASAWSVVGASSTGSIVIASETPGDMDLTNTYGTYDWMYTEAWGVGKHVWHGKALGGWLLDSFEFLSSQGASNTDARGWLHYGASSDDINTNGLHNVGNTAGVTKNFNGYNGVGIVNCGHKFRIPCSPTPRTVRWQGTAFNVQTLVTAKIDQPGVVATQTSAFNTGSGSGIDYRVAITFSGPVGSWLLVQHQVTAAVSGVGASGNLYVGPIACS